MRGKLLGLEVLLAVALGIFAGVFLGPLANIFKPIGDIFVMLLQMVVLPYICFSIVHGLGSITPLTARILFKKGWHFWVLLWGIMFLVIYLFLQLIPKAISGPFVPPNYSSLRTSLTQNILSYLVPENPFYDLANNIVPGVAIFGVIAGLALMHIPQKEPLLGFLERINQIIEKILKWIAIISPIGVFAHLAVVTGTVHIGDLQKIEVYVVCFIAICLFLTFLILPLLLCCFTPMKYRDVMKAFRSVCLLSFVTGLPTIAIPFINMHLRKLEEQYNLKEQEFRTTSQTIMPLGYAFAQIGNALLLFFIFFVSFYYRNPFSVMEEMALSLLTIPLSIGASGVSVNAVSFVIGELGFPSQAVELFTQTMAITLNFQVLLSVASVLTFSILVLFSYYKLLEIRLRQAITRGALAFGILAGLIFSVKPFLHLDDNYKNLYMDLSIRETISNPVEAKIYLPGDEIPRLSEKELQMMPFERVLYTGVLRVGYHPEVVPYSYFNDLGQLAGYDIAMAYQLARDLDCRLAFIPIEIEQLDEELNAGLYDIAMSAILMSENRIKNLDFSHFYTEQDNVLIVPLAKKKKFENLEHVVAKKGVRIGATGAYKSIFTRHFPNAILVEGVPTDLIDNKADAWIWSHIPAFIWCLNYPKFAVATYEGLLGKRYFAYPVKMGANKFLSFLNNWMDLKAQSGFTHDQYHYWILGTPTSSEKTVRWSILRNVLHWVE